MSDIVSEVRSGVGLVTLNRPKALNALSLGMIRELTALLLDWQGSPGVRAVAFRGQGREGPFGAFCAGGDIRFFHQAAIAGDPRLEDFFTEEYALDHLVREFGKPCVALIDGVVMGGGMGLAQGTGLRVATERTRMAMPETLIGLFPDVGGGFFLSRCPGRIGEYLALTGHTIGGVDACAAGLADAAVDSSALPALWDAMGAGTLPTRETLSGHALPGDSALASRRAEIDSFFSLPTVTAIVQALEADGSAWAGETAQALRKRSPLMLHVTLEQLRRGRGHARLADSLRMERSMMRRSFHLRPGADSETAEGIRALVIDKDHEPRWNPARIEDVTPEMVDAFFQSPWPDHAHPLRHLA